MKRNKPRIRTIDELRRAYNFDRLCGDIEQLKKIDISGKLDISKIEVLLWSGSWSSGSIIVPGIDNYTYIYVKQNAVSIPCIVRDNAIGGITAYTPSNTSYINTYQFYCDRSGDMLIWANSTYVSHISAGVHGTNTSTPIIAIYGVI